MTTTDPPVLELAGGARYAVRRGSLTAETAQLLGELVTVLTFTDDATGDRVRTPRTAVVALHGDADADVAITPPPTTAPAPPPHPEHLMLGAIKLRDPARLHRETIGSMLDRVGSYWDTTTGSRDGYVKANLDLISVVRDLEHPDDDAGAIDIEPKRTQITGHPARTLHFLQQLLEPYRPAPAAEPVVSLDQWNRVGS